MLAQHKCDYGFVMNLEKSATEAANVTISEWQRVSDQNPFIVLQILV